MKRRIFMLVSLITAVAMAVAGCTKNKGYTTVSDTKTELTIAWWGDETRNQYTQELLELYEQLHPDISFTPIPMSKEEYSENLAKATAMGECPDIVQMDASLLSVYEENKTLADLTGFVESKTIYTDSLDPELRNTGIRGGILAGIPVSVSIPALGYDREILKEAGVEIPANGWDWDTFFQACSKVKEQTGRPGLVSDFSDSTMLSCWLQQRNETLFDESGQEVNVTEDTLTAYFQYCSALMESETLVSVWGEDILPVSDQGGYEDAAAGAFSFGTKGIAEQGRTGDIEVTDPPSDGDDNRFIVRPELFLSVSTSLPPEKQTAAAGFINWFINDPNAVRSAGTERGIPASLAARSLLCEDERMTSGERSLLQFYGTKETGKKEYENIASPHMETVNRAYSHAMRRLFKGEITPQEAAGEFLYQIDR